MDYAASATWSANIEEGSWKNLTGWTDGRMDVYMDGLVHNCSGGGEVKPEHLH